MTLENQDIIERIDIIQKYLRKWKSIIKNGSSLEYSDELAVRQMLELAKYGGD